MPSAVALVVVAEGARGDSTPSDPPAPLTKDFDMFYARCGATGLVCSRVGVLECEAVERGGQKSVAIGRRRQE